MLTHVQEKRFTRKSSRRYIFLDVTQAETHEPLTGRRRGHTSVTLRFLLSWVCVQCEECSSYFYLPCLNTNSFCFSMKHHKCLNYKSNARLLPSTNNNKKRAGIRHYGETADSRADVDAHRIHCRPRKSGRTQNDDEATPKMTLEPA